MGLVKRFLAYAQAFEGAYEDDDWSRLEEYFTADAVYDNGGGKVIEGRDAVLAWFKGDVASFDRRFDSRSVKLTDRPKEENDTVSVGWEAVYTKSGVPDLVIAGKETAEFEGDRIRVLRDEFTNEAQATLKEWMGKHGGLLE